MKRAISILMLLVLLLLIFEFCINFLKTGHEVSYQVFYEDKVFNVVEIYQKDENDTYDIKIEYNNIIFSYVINNKLNKQKEIIKKIEYFNDNDNICIYPVLINDNGTYIECVKDGKIYTANSYYNQDFISLIKNKLIEKQYNVFKNIDFDTIEKINNTTVYTNNMLDNDIINLWSYKGIDVIKKDSIKSQSLLSFDKYENNLGVLVGKYYIVPNYLNSKVLEFSSIHIVDITNYKIETIHLDYTLSSNTYINGIVDNKLYYTDPSNLLQVEINPSSSNIRLIGSKDIGGQLYDGSWKNANIYDFVNKKIKFEIENLDIQKFNYVEYVDSGNSYYFYNNSGEVYQVSKNYLDNPVLLFKINGINNFEVIGNTIYYIVYDTIYYYNNEDGIVPIIKNNDFRYNKTNRLEVYRKS